MSQRNSSTRRPKPTLEPLLKEALFITKKSFHRCFRNLKCFLVRRLCREFPETPLGNPIFSGSRRLRTVNPVFQARDRKDDASCGCKKSVDVSDQSRLKVLEGKRGCFLAADSLARKMKELEMMDLNDENHALDLQEVLHYYSLLTSPVYLEIVDRFFMDMYTEFLLLHLSKSSAGSGSSMRKLSSVSVNGSMRRTGGGSAVGSTRKIGSGGTVHMRNLCSSSSTVHSSRRINLRSSSSTSARNEIFDSRTSTVHHGGNNSMRKLDSASIGMGSRRINLGSSSFHGCTTTRKVDSASCFRVNSMRGVHYSTRNLASLKP